MKASIKPVLLKHKKLSNGKYPVFLRVTINRKIKYFSFGSDYCCSDKEWSKREGVFKSTVKDYLSMNSHIEDVVLKARKAAINLEQKSIDYTLEDFILAYTRKGNSILVLEYFTSIINELNNANKIGNADVYEDTKKSIKRFLEEKKNIVNSDISLSSIDNKFLSEYETFLRKKCSDTTIHLRMRTLRAVFNKAKDEEGFEYYPFAKYKLTHLNTKTTKRALKTIELKKIFDYQADKKLRKYHSLNYFKFMYYCRGMNFTDLCLLKKDQIERNSFTYIRAKTKMEYTVHLFSSIRKIINEYKVITTGSPYVFPIVTKEHDTEKKINKRIQTALKGLNSDLKEMATDLKLKKKVTSYTSRHSFATVLKMMGESTEIISEHLGHANPTVTQIYLDSFEEKTLRKSAEKAIKALE